MTPRQARRMLSIAKALDAQAQRADELEIKLSTGGYLDSNLAELATDLRHQVFSAITSQRGEA